MNHNEPGHVLPCDQCKIRKYFSKSHILAFGLICEACRIKRQVRPTTTQLIRPKVTWQ